MEVMENPKKRSRSDDESDHREPERKRRKSRKKRKRKSKRKRKKEKRKRKRKKEKRKEKEKSRVDVAKGRRRAKKLARIRERHEETVIRARRENKETGTRGKVICDKLPYRFSKGVKTWPKVVGYKNVNVCSGSGAIYKNLSPMKLGPIEVKVPAPPVEGDEEPAIGHKTASATNLENLWQAHKVWPGDLVGYEECGMVVLGGHLPIEQAKDLEIKQSWYDRRDGIIADPKPHRHVNKAVKGANRNIPVFSLWVDQETEEILYLSYLEARKAIYCPLYEKLARETPAYKQLESLLRGGTNLQILGYDGYSTSVESLAGNFADDTKPFGHELCLFAMLQEGSALPWENGEQ